jgi:hypothetical protein
VGCGKIQSSPENAILCENQVIPCPYMLVSPSFIPGCRSHGSGLEPLSQVHLIKSIFFSEVVHNLGRFGGGFDDLKLMKLQKSTLFAEIIAFFN